MKSLVLVIFFAASACYAQQTAPPAQPLQQPPAKISLEASTITVPAGTQIALTLASPIATKAKKGDAVRAAVAFPVTVANQVAIPVGTYAQGVITKIVKHSRSGPSVSMQFSSLVYSSGYTLALDATNLPPGTTSLHSKAAAPTAPSNDAPVAGLGKYALAAQAFGPTPPTLTPPPMHGPPNGFIIGAVASAVATVVLAIILSHRGGSGPSDGVLFDTGWQFNVVLSKPLAVDAAKTVAAR